ncbi:MAG TPA: glycosyltransferase family 2 protein [Hanamia sp.]|nr:glycosyltransferase family 2 protein [Hanamia sp.]
MTISGFSMVRNATKLYYPIRASIESILPIVDEFIIALGKGDADDHTLEEIQKIQSDKIKIIHTEWDIEKYSGGSEYAHQTDIAKQHCKGDWLFYLQSDEVIHEKYLPGIKKRCTELLSHKEVEGLLFQYKHFWGDYSHYILSHAWYPKEIRIIRNHPGIHSWRDAQSFRRIPGFDGASYFQKENTFKLKVAEVDAFVYHYGWVRPPELMQKKRVSFETHKQGEEKAVTLFKDDPDIFNYGNLNKLCVFKGTHPAVMKDFIKKFNWENQLYPQNPLIKKHKHDKLKYRLLSFVEQNILGGNQIAGFKNYQLINSEKIN